MADYARILTYTPVYTGCKWSLGETYDTLVWDPTNVVPKPTQAELDAATPVYPDVVDYVDQALFKIAFNHENRIRALENKSAITMNQFKTAVRALL